MSTTLLLLAQNDNGVFVFGGAMFLVFVLIAILASIFWIWMLIDALTNARFIRIERIGSDSRT